MSLEITRSDARVAALAGLIDYAGLFPPARLEMAAAVAGYRSARGGSNAWMVDRFVCPASRLTELTGVLMATMGDGEEPWRLTVTADGGPDEIGVDALLIDTFEVEMDGAAIAEAVEMPLPSSDATTWIARAADLFSRAMFFEIPWREGGTIALDSVASARDATRVLLGAKLRCGGLAADAFPPPEVVAVVIAACRDRGLPLKTTAGLHHPFRHLDPATGFTHHGFVNLLVACTAAEAGRDMATLTAMVADDDPRSFALDREGVRWRDEKFGASSVSRGRQSLFVGYGSCSFDEPVDDLTALGVLPVMR